MLPRRSHHLANCNHGVCARNFASLPEASASIAGLGTIAAIKRAWSEKRPVSGDSPRYGKFYLEGIKRTFGALQNRGETQLAHLARGDGEGFFPPSVIVSSNVMETEEEKTSKLTPASKVVD